MASVLLNVALLLATSVVLAEEPTLPANDRLRLGVRTGIQAFDYHEKIGAIDSDYTSVGPAVGFSTNLRIVDRLRFNLDYLGAFIQEDTETWDNIGTVAGLPVTQENALNVDFHAFDIDLGYSIARYVICHGSPSAHKKREGRRYDRAGAHISREVIGA